jgi:hypothetical protein
MADPQSTKADFEQRFWSRIQRAEGDGCWIWTAARFPAGYGKVALPRSRKLEGAHRIAWILTNGPIPFGLWVLHRCDNRPCCRPDHLFLGTCADNVADMIAKGRHLTTGRVRSHRQATAKLSEDQVAMIRSRVAAGESRRSVARDVQINRRTVDRIVLGQAYKPFTTALDPASGR